MRKAYWIRLPHHPALSEPGSLGIKFVARLEVLAHDRNLDTVGDEIFRGSVADSPQIVRHVLRAAVSFEMSEAGVLVFPVPSERLSRANFGFVAERSTSIAFG